MFGSIPRKAKVSISEFEDGGVAESVREGQLTPSAGIAPSQFIPKFAEPAPSILLPNPLSCEDGESSPPLPPSCAAGAFTI